MAADWPKEVESDHGASPSPAWLGHGGSSHRLDGDDIRIGRSRGNDVVVRDLKVSREHARLYWSDGSWLIVDLGSRSGTTVNGERFSVPRVLESGDRIELGTTVMVFHCRTPAASSGSSEEDTDGGASCLSELLVGASPSLRELRKRLALFAARESTVLVDGETGTGKERAAHLLHLLSRRSKKPYAVVNCPALPGGLLEAELFGIERGVATGVQPRVGRLEAADGGTVVLDEVGEMDLSVQSKLLRVLQEGTIDRVGGREPRSIDVRFIAVTNRHLEREVERGTFRADLYHRLNVLRLRMPTLRDRLEDVRPLCAHFLRQCGEGVSVSDDAYALLEQYDWPGNVRELQHALESSTALVEAGRVIRTEHLPPTVRRVVSPVERAVLGQPADESTPTPIPSLTAEAAIEAEVDALLWRLIDRGESFWDVVYEPYRQHSLLAEPISRLVERALASAKTYRQMARAWGIHDQREYRKLIDFLRGQRLTP